MSDTGNACPLQSAHGYDQLWLPEHDIQARSFFARCIESEEFQLAKSEREQVHLVRKWADEHYPFHLTYQQIADFFGIGKSTVYYHLSRPYDMIDGCIPGRSGRPSTLDSAQLEALGEFIRERFAQKYPVSYEDCRDFLQERFDIVVNLKSLRGLVARSTNFRTVTGVPMDQSRIYCSEEQIECYFDRVTEVLRLGQIPAAFVVNIDETGFDSYVDARKSYRIVLAEYELNSIPVPATRREKRATLLAGICCDGSALKPMIVLPRDTMERELFLLGYTRDKIHFASSPKGFMNTSLFQDWATQTFFPEMRERRRQHKYEGPILLIMDGFGVHHNNWFAEACEEENVVCVFLPPHSSDQLQPCDLGIFSNQKRWQSNIQTDGDLNRQTRQVIRIIDSFRMATTYKNVVSSFRKSGIIATLDEATGRLMASVDKRFATAVCHLQSEEITAMGKMRTRI